MVRQQTAAPGTSGEVRPQAAAVQCLRDWTTKLRRQGYDLESIRQLFGIRYADELSAADREAWAFRLQDRNDAPTLWVKLFWLELPVRRDVVASQAGRLLEPALRAGLLQRRAERVVSCLRAEPLGRTIVWADCRFEERAKTRILQHRGGPVYPPSFDSHVLAEATPRLHGGHLLDLCTGSGVLALNSAKQGTKVVGVDIEPRAVEMASLNALANGVKSARFLLGDLYAAVEGKRFHYIIANPPFVCSPYASGPRYHSGGPLGDQVLHRVVAGFAPHLHLGGKAVTISHVGLRPGESLVDRARSWVGNFDGRCLVVEFARADTVSFAAEQASFALAQGTKSFRRELLFWLRFLCRHGIHEVAAVLLAAERTGVHHLDVVSAKPVVVPVPLNKSATQVVSDWWTS